MLTKINGTFIITGFIDLPDNPLTRGVDAYSRKRLKWISKIIMIMNVHAKDSGKLNTGMATLSGKGNTQFRDQD